MFVYGTHAHTEGINSMKMEPLFEKGTNVSKDNLLCKELVKFLTEKRNVPLDHSKYYLKRSIKHAKNTNYYHAVQLWSKYNQICVCVCVRLLIHANFRGKDFFAT